MSNEFDFKNDGYLYCINTDININDKLIVKIGKIGMKMNETEIQVENKLSRRYSTYYPEHNLLYFQRVNNCHKAEIDLFESISSLRYKRELFYYDKDAIEIAFSMISKKYPDIDNMIKKMDINELTQLNKDIRMKNTMIE